MDGHTTPPLVVIVIGIVVVMVVMDERWGSVTQVDPELGCYQKRRFSGGRTRVMIGGCVSPDRWGIGIDGFPASTHPSAVDGRRSPRGDDVI